MNAIRQRKLLYILVAFVVLALAVGLVLYALRQNISLFYTPTALRSAPKVSAEHLIRLGGIVRGGSVQHGRQLVVRFEVTDGQQVIPVIYRGVLPDLFREGKSTVAEGFWTGRTFKAQRVLAKHDENYMPAEVQQALRDKT